MSLAIVRLVRRARLRPSRTARQAAMLLLLAGLLFGCVRAPNDPRSIDTPESLPARSAIDTPNAIDPANAAPTDATAAAPPFYRVEGVRGADLLLLGTLHFGPPEGWTLSHAVQRGLAQADGFVLEVDLRREDSARLGDLVAALAVLPPGRRLRDLVEPETAALLDAQDARLAALGFPRGARDGRAPWYLATALVELPVAANGWSLAASVDLQVLGSVGGRPVLGLETAEEQLRMLAGLPPAIQDLMLRDTLARLDDAPASLRALARAWQAGDETTLEAHAREGVDALPGLTAFYETLLDERNRRWVPKLRALLDDPAQAGETHLVAVGALHLPGRQGLVALLREAGYRTMRIEARGTER